MLHPHPLSFGEDYPRVLTAYKRCLVTGLSETALLVASHIKPWRDCRENPDDCLNPDNALLLSPNWDTLFDKGFISFADGGALLISKRLSEASRRSLGIEALNVSLSERQRYYLIHHRSLHGFE
ncbi:HNH endonuclease [Loktanella sp. TSTF-M6]|uniref:HNH endonuclease n=1 Tax=Loktanella gaetbuli TaxID=2881335 RepID=A0ABS8BT06_9RHOB|nr:HNH endonuclease [Loktanella gaetbuli]